MFRVLLGSLITAVLLAVSPFGFSQGKYPSKTVEVVVPYAPGGGSDATTRNVAQKLSEDWKQQVIVDNRGGAGGLVRAYGGAAAECLRRAQRRPLVTLCELRLHIGFDDIGAFTADYLRRA